MGKTYVLLPTGWFEVCAEAIQHQVCYIVCGRDYYYYVSDGWMPERGIYHKPNKATMRRDATYETKQRLRESLQESGKHVFMARPEKYGPPVRKSP